MEIRQFKDEKDAKGYLMPQIMKVFKKSNKNAIEEEINNIIASLNDPDGANVRSQYHENDIIAAAQYFPIYCELNGKQVQTSAPAVNQNQDTDETQVTADNKKKTKKKERYNITEGLNFIEEQNTAINEEVEGKKASRFKFTSECSVDRLIFKQDKLENLLKGTKATPITITDEAKADIALILAKDPEFDPDGSNAAAWSEICTAIAKNEAVDIKFPKTYGKVEGAVINIPASLSAEEGRAKDGKLFLPREELKAFLLEKTLGGINATEEGLSVEITEVEGAVIKKDQNGAGVEDATAVVKIKFTGQSALASDAALAAKHAMFVLIPTETDPASFTGNDKSVTLVKSVKVHAKDGNTIDKNAALKTKSMKGKVQMPAMTFNPELEAVGYPAPKDDKAFFKIASEDDEAAKKKIGLLTSAYQQMVKGRVSTTSSKLNDFASKVNKMTSANAEKDINEIA